MWHQDFSEDAPGQLVPTTGNALAFVPDPLPPRIDLAQVAMPLSNAKLALGELKGVSRNLSNPYLLIAPLQRREALSSSAMEGTHTTADALLLAQAGFGQQDADTVEVSNYVVALRAALEELKTIPISHRLLCNAHRRLLTDVVHGRGANKRPGEYKLDQNWIGGATLPSARFVPAPPAETLDAMNRLEAWINQVDGQDVDPLVAMAMAHYQFETIHPFSDGNGRLGRLLVTLMSISTGLLALPILYVSPAIEHRKDEYIDKMYAVSARGAWETWIAFFCDVVAESCHQTIATVDRLDSLHADCVKRVRSRSNSANDLAVLDMLFEQPVLRLSLVRDRLGLTPQGARNVVDRLISTGILTELPGFFPKIFYSQGILAVADA